MNHSNEIELLKWIGIFSMVLDHVGVILPQYEILRIFGRLAFPIFGFILIYNYLYHTKDKYKYIKRIVIFAIISEPIHFLFFQHNYSGLNIFLMYGLVLSFLFFYELIKIEKMPYYQKLVILTLFSIVSICISQYIEFGIDGFLLMISYYFMLKNKYFTILTILFLMFLNTLNILYVLFSCLSLVIIYFVLNRNIKISIPRHKYFFYLFYPLHLIIFMVVQSLF